MTSALTLSVNPDLSWSLEDGDKRHPVHINIGNVGWFVEPLAWQGFGIESYGVHYYIILGKSGRNIISITDKEGGKLSKMVICDGHPAAWFFKKTITFDDGVEREVPIAQMKPTQPY